MTKTFDEVLRAAFIAGIDRGLALSDGDGTWLPSDNAAFTQWRATLAESTDKP